MKNVRPFTFFLVFILTGRLLYAQSNTYILNGSATQNSCNCYTLTPAVNTQSGSVWNANKINLNNPFDFVFNVYLGCKDADGADGIVFILQPISTSVGASGGGLGFQGIVPSVGVVLDTWQNTNNNDPPEDHIAIMANGNLDHGSDLAGPVPISASSGNVEDCNWHTVRIVWDPAAKEMSTYFDGVFRLRSTVDLIATIFNNDPMVFWGFSAGTGGSNNLQQFCTALNPQFSTTSSSNSFCLGTPVQFTSTSQSFTTVASYNWNFGDNQTSTLQNPPPHLYAQPGTYTASLTITGMDGCISTPFTRTITIGDFPVADFTVFDTCKSTTARLVNNSSVQVGTLSQWQWLLDGNTQPNQQLPALTNLSPGSHQLQLVATSNIGCSSSPVTKTFFVNQLTPNVSHNMVNDAACLGNSVSFTNTSQATTAINGHYWNFGDNQASTLAIPSPHIYTNAGVYEIKYAFTTPDGCTSDTVRKTVTIADIPVIDFTVKEACVGIVPTVTNNSTVQAGTITQWQWLLDGNSLSTQQTPQLPQLPQGPHQLQLTATSSYGCASPMFNYPFTVFQTPVVTTADRIGCAGVALPLTATQVDNLTTIASWNWNFGDNQTGTQQNPTHTYVQTGNYTASVSAMSDKGCPSAVVQRNMQISRIVMNAGNDTTIIENEPYLMMATASSQGNPATNLQYQWSPSVGLNDANSLTPTLVLSPAQTQTYLLTINSGNGCVANDAVTITVIKEPVIRMPTGFTPNNDGKNDLFKPLYIGIKSLDYFRVYNRWGVEVFSTKSTSDFWNGTYKSSPQPSGVYVWMIQGRDIKGNIHTQKGTVTIIR